MASPLARNHMTLRRMLARGLVHHRAVHGAVALAVAIGTAILAGALMVGSSVRGSLRSLTLDRLGAIDFAAVGDRYFRESVPDALEGFDGAAAAILVRGSAEHPDSGARASRVRIHGVDSAFWRFYEVGDMPTGARDVAVNRQLAAELGVQAGEDILLRIHTDTLVPAESVMGRKSDNVRLIRLRISTVLGDRGPGRFGLSPQQQLPYNAFVSMEVLQRALERPGRANALFLAGGTREVAIEAWREAFSLEDAALAVKNLPAGGGLLIETERVVLDRPAVEAIGAAAEDTGFASDEVLTYLANVIEANGRTVPYSTVTALSAWPPSLRLAGDGGSAGPAPGEIVLNAWTADDLGARPGDAVTLTYYVVGPDSTLETASHRFRLAGIVGMEGAALDSSYAPTFKGMSDRARISNWDPPFPMDLRLIRPRDEDYWDRYRASPKAFISLPDAKALWSSRFGQLTSVRVQPPANMPAEAAATRFADALSRRLDPAAFGLSLQPVKLAGLAASSGSTDFSGLFLGFSLFLIGSAAILVALLFRLGVERRAREIGLLLATGHTPGMVRRLLMAEAAVLAIAGCLVGIPGAIAYAQAMLYGLSTWWSGAVGGTFLEFHFRWQDSAIGATSTLALTLTSVRLSLRKLVRLSPNALLSGKVSPLTTGTGQVRTARRLRRAGAVLAVLAVALLAMSLGGNSAARLGAFYGAGTLALAASLTFFRSLLLAPPRDGQALAGIDQLGFRNGGRNPTRSVLSTALVACASFMIVTVAMNRHDVRSQQPTRDSGDGGFRLMAESDIPFFQHRIDEAATDLGASARMFPIRIRAGEDASCLNLYQPSNTPLLGVQETLISNPTLMGVQETLIRRGGFAFQGTLAETEEERRNPWLLLKKDFGGPVPVFADGNSATWILRLSLGDEMSVEDSRGRPRQLILAGLLSRSIFQSELVLAESNFLNLYPGHSGYQGLLVETDSDAVATELEVAFADEGLDAVRTSDRLAGYLVVENTYLSTFRTLGGLGLLLGTLGLAVVMVRSVLERRGELALLEALGFARGSISRLILAENSFLLVFGVASGTAAALIAVAPHLASGEADPPWASLLSTLAAIILLGLLAGAAAVALSLRAPLLPSLRRD